MLYPTVALKFLKQLIFKFSSLVMMNFGRETESQNEIIKDLLCCHFARLVWYCISLSKLCKVVYYYQNVLHTTLASLQMQIIDGDYFKRC